MLQSLVDYVIPSCLFLLMFVAGTGVRKSDLLSLSKNPRAVVMDSLGQLLLLPPLALLLNAALHLPPPIASSILLLAFCPNGGISNYYCYLARCSVLLSASITTLSTVLCLVTIPVWLSVLSNVSYMSAVVVEVQAPKIVLQLVVLMLLPISLGILVRRAFPIQDPPRSCASWAR